MATIQGLNPYDPVSLLAGSARVLFTPTTGSTVPVKLSDIFGQTGPNYAPTSPWLDLGAAKGGESADYTRGLDAEGYEIEQVTGQIFEEITDAPRTLAVNIAEVTDAHLQLTEQGPAPITVAAATGYAASKRIPFGSISGLTAYRVALIGRRPKNNGADITEPGGTVRGSFVGMVFYNCTISPKDSGISLKKGEMAALPLEFTAHPDSTQTSGSEVGCWLTETGATTIT